MFTEVNAKKFSEEPIQFQNLRFKNNVKIHPTSKCLHFFLNNPFFDKIVL